MPRHFHFECDEGHRFLVSCTDANPDETLSCPFCKSDAEATKQIQWGSRAGSQDLPDADEHRTWREKRRQERSRL